MISSSLPSWLTDLFLQTRQWTSNVAIFLRKEEWYWVMAQNDTGKIPARPLTDTDVVLSERREAGRLRTSGHCNSLNENGPTGPQGAALLGGVALSKSITSRQTLRFQSLFLLPEDPDVELSAPSPAPCLPAYHHASCHEDNGPSL